MQKSTQSIPGIERNQASNANGTFGAGENQDRDVFGLGRRSAEEFAMALDLEPADMVTWLTLAVSADQDRPGPPVGTKYGPHATKV